MHGAVLVNVHDGHVNLPQAAVWPANDTSLKKQAIGELEDQRNNKNRGHMAFFSFNLSHLMAKLTAAKIPLALLKKRFIVMKPS